VKAFLVGLLANVNCAGEVPTGDLINILEALVACVARLIGDVPSLWVIVILLPELVRL
jgi:hypothetical protein